MIRFTAAGMILAVAGCAPQQAEEVAEAASTPDAAQEAVQEPGVEPAPQRSGGAGAPVRANPELAFAIHAGRGADLATRRALGARLDRMQRDGLGPVTAPPPPPPSSSSSTTTAGTSSTYIGGPGFQVTVQPVWHNLHEVVLTETSTGLAEIFLLNLPPPGQPQPVPLLVVFHKFGSSHWDAYFNTDFVTEAVDRGWFLIAPLSASTKHFGSTLAQEHTQIVMDWVLSHYASIDRDRIYGVGFSMGGGAMLSFAARHLDPDRGMFAAMLTHTGGGALKNTYYNEPDDDDADDDIQSGANLETPDILDYWYGGSPTDFPFEYQSHSVLDMDAGGTIDPTGSMLPNLKHVAIHTWYANGDPLAYLASQTQGAFGAFLTWVGGPAFLTVVAASQHRWTTLDEKVTCDWLAQRTLQMPTAGDLLADRDGVWLHFDLQQGVPNAFSRVAWAVDAGTNAISLLGTHNLDRIVVDLAGAGLDPAVALTLDVSGADGTGDTVVLSGMTQAPNGVLRDGVASPSWTYDAVGDRLVIDEPDAGLNQWTITFN